ncbi:MAG TPA: hypothetical protein VIY26_02100 [Acidimicrobiales bacterium]
MIYSGLGVASDRVRLHRIGDVPRLLDDDIDDFGDDTLATPGPPLTFHGQRAPQDAEQDQSSQPKNADDESDYSGDDGKRKERQVPGSVDHLARFASMHKSTVGRTNLFA